jgi:3-dehydroquinate dehydratase/shikimate dehydrogenase
MSLVPDRICTIIARTRHKMVTLELEEAVKQGAKFLELRLDYIAKAVDYRRLAPAKKCAWLGTFRRAVDGGRYGGGESERQMFIRQMIVSGMFEWIDIETDIANSIRRFGSVKRIVSYHNLNETPENLEEIYEKMTQQDADILKVVTTAQNTTDNLRLLRILQKAKKPTVGHCIGDIGFPTRILSLKYGAPFMYAAFNTERGIAPGLPSLKELKRLYPISAIDSQTRLFGVIGDPVAHSYSPALHNGLFHRDKINALYLPLRVPRGALKQALDDYQSLGFEGYSVTIPHKEAAAALASSVDPQVIQSKAANTLLVKPEGLIAANSDYKAALESLMTQLPVDENGTTRNLKDCTAMILGAGGAARAIAHALHSAGVHHLYIASRTLERAEQLANEVQGKAVEWGRRHQLACDILINCTPIGMHPDLDASPIHFSYFKPGMTVFDTVYNPENTLFIKEARQRACRVVTGIEMFVRQAALQYEMFTGITPDLEMMREIMRQALSPLRPLEEKDEE